MRLFPRRLDSGELEAWQPRLYVFLLSLVLLAAYVIAFVVQNDEQIEVDFVVVSARVSLIWLILLSLAIGVVAGVLLSQLYRRRKAAGGPGD